MPSNSTEQDGDVRRSRELDPRVPDVALARIQCHKLDFPHLRRQGCESAWKKRPRFRVRLPGWTDSSWHLDRLRGDRYAKGPPRTVGFTMAPASYRVLLERDAGFRDGRGYPPRIFRSERRRSRRSAMSRGLCGNVVRKVLRSEETEFHYECGEQPLPSGCPPRRSDQLRATRWT
jgi:hypothetical protein